MKKLALCIGNDDYEILPRLNCCIADATAIEEQLKNLGFDTIWVNEKSCVISPSV